MYNNGTRVVPTTRAAPIWPPRYTLDAGETDIKFYTLLQEGKEFPATVPVSVRPRTGPLVPENLYVRTMGKWTPLKDWLLELADDEMIRRRSSGRAARIWWERNGIIAPLMKLPVELRLQILEYVIAPQSEIYPISLIGYDDYNDNGSKENRAQAHVIVGIGYDSRNFDFTIRGGRCYTALCYLMDARTPVSPPNTALLLVSKQIHQEAMQAGWEGVKRCFMDHQIFTAVSDSKIGAALNFNILGLIELSFANKGWFKFLGVYGDTTAPYLHYDEARSQAHYLSKLSKSTQLYLRFRDPSDGLTGYINKPQKAKWIRVFQQLTSFDYKSAIEAIFANPASKL